MSKSGIVSIILLAVFGYGMLSTQNTLTQRYTPESALNEIMYLPDGKILKVASLGFYSLIADVLWLKSVLYFGKFMFDGDNPYVDILVEKRDGSSQYIHHHHDGDEHDHAHEFLDGLQELNQQHQPISYEKIEHKHSGVGKGLVHDPNLQMLHEFQGKGLAPYIYPLLQRVVELDPYFMAPYRFGGLIVLHETGEIDRAYELLQHGWKYNSNNWEIAYYLGFIDLLYKGDTHSALKWLSLAQMQPNHPPFIRRIYDSLIQHGNYRNIVVDYLKGFYQSSEDEQLRKQVLKMLEKLAQTPPS